MDASKHKGDQVSRKNTRTAWAVLVALVLMVPLLIVGVGPAEGATDRVMTIRHDNSSWRTFDGNPPKVYDFDGDGNLEIIAQHDNHRAYVYDSTNGNQLASLKATVPSGWGARTFNGPEAAVLTSGGSPYLIQASSAAVITAWRFDASQSNSGYFHFVKDWERRLDRCNSDPGMDAKVVFADLTQDGNLEIIGSTEEQGIYALRHDGSILWRNCVSGGNAAPGIGDLNGDGHPDVIHVNDAGLVAALNGKTGGWMWSFSVRDVYGLGSGAIPVQPAVAQLDGQGGPDIVVGARDSHDSNNFDNNHARIVALNHNGRVLWTHQHSQANPLTYTRPIIADADEDGKPEVYWADWNTMGHKPGNWEHMGPANFYKYDRFGNLQWRTSLDTWWSNKDLSIGDVDGGGAYEVLANGPNSNGEDGIWYLDVHTGNKERFVSVSPWKVQRAPILADLWSSGTMQWIVQVAHTGNNDDAILVYDTNAPYDVVWPHVPYPNDPDRGSGGGGGGGGDFSASYSGVQGNEWWIQTQVDASGGSLASVDVRLDGGSWRPLEDEGWGWAASYHAPEGTIVQLRATSTGGDRDFSGCYRWTSASTTSCDSGGGGGGGGGDFSASFSPGSGSNEWWVETYVSSSRSIDRVDARVDGGSWQSLSKTDWGSWAKSIHAPDGSIVQFRALSGGDTARSDCYRWTEATKTSCGSGFDAGFAPASGSNEWWVEVYVDGNEGIAAVDARVNDGSWQRLSKTDWGSWAKSMHAPDGSEVQFRAHSTSGATDLSQRYTW